MRSLCSLTSAGAVLCLALSNGCSRSSNQLQPLPITNKNEKAPVVEANASSERITNRKYYRQTWAVVIGIDKYGLERTGFLELTNAVNDAQAIRAMLRDEFGYQDDNIDDDEDDHVLVLLNDRATRDGIQSALAEWMNDEKIKPDDAVLIYFSGHGAVEDNEGYLASWDSRKGKLKDTGISVSNLRNRLARLQARHKAIILDSCSSASLFAGIAVQSEPLVESEQAGRVTETRGDAPADFDRPVSYHLSRRAFLGMAAARSAAADQGGKNGHSLFTWHLLQVLKERADSKRQDHLFRFRTMAAQVAERVEEAKGSYQSPQFRYLGSGSGDFLFKPKGRRRLTPTERKRRELYCADIRSAYRAWKRNDSEESLRLLSKHVPSSSEEDLRSFEWYFLRRVCEPAEHTIAGHLFAAMDVCFGGTLLASIDAQGIVKVWDVATAKEVASIQQQMQIPLSAYCGVALSPDDTFVATAGFDKAVSIWNVKSGQRVLSLDGHKKDTTRVAFSPDGKLLASGSKDHTVKVWDAKSGRELLSFEGHSRTTTCVAFSSDGNLLISGSEDWTVKVWDIKQKRERATFSGHTMPVIDVAFAGNYRVASAATNLNDVLLGENVNKKGEIKIWRVESDTSSFDLEVEGVVWGVAFHPEQPRLLMVAGGDILEGKGSLTLWNTHEHQKSHVSRGHEKAATSVAYSSTLPWMASGGMDGSIKFWKRTTERESLKLSAEVAPVTVSMAFSPDGRSLAVGGTGLRVFDVASGREAWSDKPEGEVVRSVAFSQDGSVLASCAGPPDNGVKVRETEGGGLVCRLLNGIRVTSVAFSPHNHVLATGCSDGTIRLVDVEKRKEISRVEGGNSPVMSVAFAPNEKHLAAGIGPVVKVWDLSTERLVKALRKNSYNVEGLAFSPDGRYLAAGGSRGSEGLGPGELKLLKVDAGFEVMSLKGVIGSVQDVVFTSDGKRLVSAGGTLLSCQVKIWDVATGEELLDVGSGMGCAMAVARGPRGELAYGGVRGKFSHGEVFFEGVSVWDVMPPGYSQALAQPR